MPAQKNFVRKHFFINRQLQGRYMIAFLVPMMIMLVFWLFTLFFASQSIIDTTLLIVRKDVEKQISVALQDKPADQVAIVQSVTGDITNYLRKFSKDKENRAEVLSSLLWIFGVGILFIIIQIVLLTVFFSHKIAGPVYRFEKACCAMIEGNFTDVIHLRKGDEMQNLAQLLNQAMENNRERFKAAIEGSAEDREEIRKKIKI